MKERPILMSAPMVRAILDGRKTQTRRVVDEGRLRVRLDRTVRSDLPLIIRPELVAPPGIYRAAMNRNGAVCVVLPDGERLGVLPDEFSWVSPYGRAGDRVWVRETWQVWTEFDDTRPCDLPTIARRHVNYPAEGNVWESRRRPSIHMPRWASRITLELTDVRVERITAISEEDARAEGYPGVIRSAANGAHPDARGWFREAWNQINARRGYPFDDGAWCWCLSFRVVAP